MSSLSRLSYSVMVGLAYQSIRSHQVMTNQLMSMANKGKEALLLETNAKEDEVRAMELEQQALADQMEASTLNTQAAVLEEESVVNMAAAQKDVVTATSYETKVTEEQVELKTHQASALAEEATVEEETWKADAEVAKATADTESVTTNILGGTAACEWIPLLDMVCDVVGGVAALAMETEASKLTVQAGLDYAFAASSKVKEDADIAVMDTLKVSLKQDTDLAVEYETKAKEEQIQAKEEAAQAKEERASAQAKSKQSQEETISSQEATVKAEMEESKSTEQITSSINNGISAFWHAFLSALLSMASFLFFAIRFLTSIVLPFGQTVITGVMSTITIVSSSSKNNHVIARNYEDSNHKTSLIGNLWTALPRREVAYFFLHCGVFVTTFSCFCLQLPTISSSSIPNYNHLRFKGGFILTFASTSAILQMILLHFLPLIIPIFLSTPTQFNTTNHKAPTNKLETTTNFLLGITKWCLHYVSLTLLFVMETLILWLIFGQRMFSWPNTITTSLLMKPIYLYPLILLTATALYHFNYYYFHMNEDIPQQTNQVTQNTDSKQQDCIVACEESSHLLPQTKANDKKSNFNKTQSFNTNYSDKDVEIMGDYNHPALDDQTVWYGYFAGASFYHDYYMTVPSISKRKVSQSYHRNSSVYTVPLGGYISSLQLPFEILLLTCMFVLIQKCSPILLTLWTKVIMTNTHHHHHLLWTMIGWSGIVILFISWCSCKNHATRSSSQGNNHTINLWSGNMGTKHHYKSLNRSNL